MRPNYFWDQDNKQKPLLDMKKILKNRVGDSIKS